jgi:hypothetical protein
MEKGGVSTRLAVMENEAHGSRGDRRERSCKHAVTLKGERFQEISAMANTYFTRISGVSFPVKR